MLDELFTTLADNRIRLKARSDGFEVIDPENNLTASLLATLKLHKPAILEYLTALTSAGQFVAMKPAEKREYYPLSSAQKRIYLLHQLDAQSLAYNIPLAAAVDGAIDIALLNDALRELVQRHEVLRSVFGMVNNTPVQMIEKQPPVNVEEYAAGQEVEQVMSCFVRPFDLTQSPLVRVGVITGSSPVLLVDMHHIITDAISFDNLVKEFIQLYRGAVLSQQQLQYKDFVMWQQFRMNAGMLAGQKNYWLNEFRQEVPVLELPSDFKRPEIKSYNGGIVNISVDSSLAIGIKQVMDEADCTPYMFFLSVFGILLSRLSNETDIVIGTPVSGRSSVDQHGMAGVFINTLPLRISLNGNQTYSDYLQQIKQKVVRALDHQEYPYEELVNELRINRDVSRNPLFDVMFALNFQGSGAKEDIGFKLQDYELDGNSSKMDLSLFVDETAQGFDLRFEYATSIFKADTVRRYAGYFLNILGSINQLPDIPLGWIDFVPESEKSVIAGFNETAVAFDRDKTVLDLFYEQVQRNPHHTALISGDVKMTYEQFNKQTNSIANALLAKQVRKNDVVALYMDRGVHFLLGVYGILKAGAVYLPVSPSLPEERALFMLKDSNAVLMLVCGQHSTDFPVVIDLLSHTCDEDAVEDVRPEANDLAYIMYTSGSTGVPKGVMIRHQSLMNRLNWMQHEYPLGENDVILHKTPVNFDVSVWELFWWAIAGGTVSVLPHLEEREPYAIMEHMKRDAITVVHFVPAMLKSFMAATGNFMPATLKWVFASGEALLPEIVNKFKQTYPGDSWPRLVNLYGPTEATIDVTCYECFHENNYETIPIGKPIHNTTLHILNEFGIQQPLGVAGELCIGGENLAAGYVNNEALTAERFVYNQQLKKRIYRTGDLASWRSDGNVEFLGRIDHQLKIRGYRIEPGEIEYHLRQVPGIDDAVVVGQVMGNEVTLCAYYTGDPSIREDGIRACLSKVIPAYMVPVFFVPMDEIPLSASGKVNRKVLPLPNMTGGQVVTAPVTAYEKTLQEIWAAVLAIDKKLIGVDTNFFSLGGHSLTAIAVLSKINEQYTTRCSLTDFFRNPTIGASALFLGKAKKDAFHRGIKPAEQKEYYRLSSAQRRIYLWQISNQGSTAYNMPFLFRINQPVAESAIVDLFYSLMQVHEILKTRFVMVDDEPVQLLDKALVPEIIRHNGPAEEMIRPFDLENGPLLRLGWIHNEREGQLLFVDMHHIIADGLSIRVMINDFVSMLSGTPVPKRAIQYKDYSEWERYNRNSAAMAEHEAYWLGRLSGGIPVMDLPYDFENKSRDYTGNNLHFSLTREQNQVLAGIAEKGHVSLFSVCLSVFSILLSRLTGQDEMMIGVTQSGRNHVDEENVAGPIVNLLPLKLKIDSSLGFPSQVKAIFDVLLEGMEHSAYPYDALADKLQIERPAGSNLLFDVACSFYSTDNDEDKNNADGWELLPLRSDVAKFNLGLYIENSGGNIHLSFEYNKGCFRKETIERFRDYFLSMVDQIGRSANNVQLLADREREEIIRQLSGPRKVMGKATFYETFKRIAQEYRHDPAVIFDDETLTYEQLERKAGAMSGLLVSRYALIPQHRVAVMLKRSPYLVLSMLAILKANLVIVPIDPELPEELIRFIMKDAAVKLLITDTSLGERYKNHPECPVFDITESIDGTDTSETILYQQDDLAYIIYTSGSTGQPKGAMIEHAGFMNYLDWANRFYCKGDRGFTMGLFTPVSFDFTLTCIFTTLLRADKLIVYSQDRHISDILTDVFNAPSAINLVKLTPSHVDILAHLPLKETAVTGVILGGEEVMPRHVEILRGMRADMLIYNEYGPTEATVGCCIKEIKDELAPISIGVPIDNTTVFLLNAHNEILPVGIKGELCIAGIQLARGYTDPDQTRAKFITLPRLGGIRVYRTGDMGKLLENGELAYLGRLDDQVKIRGYRVELRQIAAQLSQMEHIGELHVDTFKREDGTTGIVVYYRSDETIAFKTFLQYAEQCLPVYMIPSYFIRLEEIPLNINGKVDRKRLPDPLTIPDGISLSVEEEITDPLALTLRSIWGGILQIPESRISMHSNFYELGGQSISAIMLVSKILKQCQVKLEVRQILHAPTLKGQLGLIRAATLVRFRAIKPVEKKEFYKLSSAQARLLAFSMLDRNDISYNMPGAIKVSGNLDVERFTGAISALLKRHEILRTLFHFKDGEMYQVVTPASAFHIEYLDHRDSDTAIEELMKAFVRPFQLDQSIPLRVSLVKLADGSHLILHDMHHIISDGTSGSIFIREFIDLYAGKELAPLSIQYKDFANWQLVNTAHSLLQQQRTYWQTMFEEMPPALELPVDFSSGATVDAGGAKADLTIPASIVTPLKELVTKEKVTIFSLLLTAFNILFSKCCRSEDVVIGVPFEHRNHADLEGQIGVYLNLLPLRNYPAARKMMLSFLKEVQAGLSLAMEHADYQFEQLLEDIKPARVEGRDPLFDVYVNFLNFTTGIDNGIADLTFSPVDTNHVQAKYAISFYISEQEGDINITCVYKSHLFRPQTIQYLLQEFNRLLTDIASDPHRPIKDYRLFHDLMVTGQEKDIPAHPPVFAKEAIYQSIGARFEQQVANFGERTAIVWNNSRMTYHELNQQVNRLANYILSIAGGKQTGNIALLTSHRIYSIVAIMGVLKSPFSYIPMDVNYPVARLDTILKSSEAWAIVTDTAHVKLAEQLAERSGAQIICIDQLPAGNVANPDLDISHDATAYILFTSGSTGEPKGVIQSHRNVLHFCRVYTNRLQIQTEDRLTLFATYCFDAAVMDIFGALLNGACLYPYDVMTDGNMHRLKEWMVNQDITIFHAVPNLYRQLYKTLQTGEVLPSVRWVVMGGEAVYRQDVIAYKDHFRDDCLFINGLGPTESTVTLQNVIDKHSRIDRDVVSVGVPVDDTVVLILDNEGEEAPVYGEGEIVYESDYLALGYWKNDTQTRQSFAVDARSQKLRYKSGDIGRRLPDGTIEYIGRRDKQVKVRGFRIELAEIENSLLQYDQLDAAAVVFKREMGEGSLVCFYVCHVELEPRMIRQHLLGKIPAYMIPDRYVRMGSLPVNSNGKIDRNLLEGYEITNDIAADDPAFTPFELTFAALWKEILGVGNIRRNDSFFDLGGNSITLISMLTRIEKIYHVSLPVPLFITQQFYEIAENLESSVHQLALSQV